MNWDRIQGNWKQLAGRARERWGKLTDSDFDVTAGRLRQLAGKVQEHHGVVKEAAEGRLSAEGAVACQPLFADTEAGWRLP
jgi:uncharacterized protein YjbJ (UPF0337 family)